MTPNAIAAEYFPLAGEDSETVGAQSINHNPLTVAARLRDQARSLRDNGVFPCTAALGRA